jgi:hypothetical protein
MKNNQLILIVGGLLILLGLNTKLNIINLDNLLNKPTNTVDVLELSPPTDESLLKEANDVASLLKEFNAKSDAKKLRNLYMDLGRLVELDGDDVVIRNTEDIRQANSIAGPMLKLDIKGKYPNLATEMKEVIVAAIGDDQILLSPELRAKAVEGFNALAWACNEGSK